MSLGSRHWSQERDVVEVEVEVEEVEEEEVEVEPARQKESTSPRPSGPNFHRCTKTTFRELSIITFK